MSCADPQTADVVNGSTAYDAVEDDRFQLALEVGLHGQELSAKLLDVNRDRIRPIEAGGYCLIDNRIGIRRLLGDALDRSLEDLTVVGPHPNTVDLVTDAQARLATTALSVLATGVANKGWSYRPRY
jgi:hypothetical protein